MKVSSKGIAKSTSSKNTILISKKKLDHLVEQALIWQREACLFHNSLDGEMSLYSEEETITSFSLSKDSRILLANLLNEEMHLSNVEGDSKLVDKYKTYGLSSPVSFIICTTLFTVFAPPK